MRKVFAPANFFVLLVFALAAVLFFVSVRLVTGTGTSGDGAVFWLIVILAVQGALWSAVIFLLEMYGEDYFLPLPTDLSRFIFVLLFPFIPLFIIFLPPLLFS